MSIHYNVFVVYFVIGKPGKGSQLFYYIVWLLAAVLYLPVIYELYRYQWKAMDYNHAYFIIPISLWLIWQKRSILKEELIGNSRQGGEFYGFLLALFGALIFIFGWRYDYLFVSTLSLIPLISGLLIYLYGTGIAKILSFPILYLLLIIPPPLWILDSITLPMRYGISLVTEMILKSFHLPIAREGLLLSIGGHEIYMGQACSGFRSLITIFSLALVYVYIGRHSLKKKIVLVASIVPLALFGNLIRVIAMCTVTFYFGESIGRGFFHNFSGIVMFVVIILGLMGIDTLLNKFIPDKRNE